MKYIALIFCLIFSAFSCTNDKNEKKTYSEKVEKSIDTSFVSNLLYSKIESFINKEDSIQEVKPGENRQIINVNYISNDSTYYILIYNHFVYFEKNFIGYEEIGGRIIAFYNHTDSKKQNPIKWSRLKTNIAAKAKSYEKINVLIPDFETRCKKYEIKQGFDLEGVVCNQQELLNIWDVVQVPYD